MSENLEGFSPDEGAEGVDNAALERLREQMKKARQQMQGDQKQEAKQKAQEDTLYQILIAFLNKFGPDHPVVVLVARAIAHNILSELILAVLSLNYDTVQKYLGLKMVRSEAEAPTGIDEKALINPKMGANLPLHVRINLDTWLKAVNDAAFLKPIRNSAALQDRREEDEACGAFVNLMSYIAQDYLEREGVEFNPKNVLNFVSAFSHNLHVRLKQHVESTQMVAAGDSDSEE